MPFVLLKLMEPAGKKKQIKKLIDKLYFISCSYGDGGWTTEFSGISFNNVKHKTLHRWIYDVIMKDSDGSLSGKAGNVVVSRTNITDGDSRCNSSSFYEGGTVCENTADWIRFTLNSVNIGQYSIRVTNEKNNIDSSPYLTGVLTGNIYMVALEANQTYEISFDYAAYPTSLSYRGIFYGLKPNEYLIIKHKLESMPDLVNVFKTNETKVMTELSIDRNENGDWHWDNSTRTLSYIVHYKNGNYGFLDTTVAFKTIYCAYPKCQTPQQEPPVPFIPSGSGSSSGPSSEYSRIGYSVFYWSEFITWEYAKIIRSGQVVTNLTGLPQDYDSVKIPEGIWVIVDISLPILTTLQIDGVLEFNDSLDNTLSVNQILINGQLIIGWENKTFTHNVNIELVGNRTSKSLSVSTEFNWMGRKSIGVHGGMDLHGTPRNPAWTKINETAKAGSSYLVLIEPVDWKVDEEIVLTTTSYSPFETETFKIVAVSSDHLTITLNTSLKYDHIAMSENIQNGKSYSIAAGVGLLTRNIKITGGQYSTQYDELFGSRIIVSSYDSTVYTRDRLSFTKVHYVGFLRISDVEFNLFGQYSTYAKNDFGYGILFYNLGSYSPTRPTYIKNSAFHNGFSAAIGIIKSDRLPITNNVFHHTLDYALWIEGNANILRNNLIALNIWSPTILTRYASTNKMYFGAIELSSADSAVVENNFIAGSQRVGLHFRGSPCAGTTLTGQSIKGNSIYGSLFGAAVITPSDSLALDCLQFSNFIIYKSVSAGFYVQSTANLIFDSNTLIDNQISIFPQVYTPKSTSHDFRANRSILISNNLIIGTSPSFNCSSDIPPVDTNSKYSTVAQAYGTESGGRIGVVWGNFLDGHNNAPLYPFFNIMTYNYINGLSTLDNNTFAYFKTVCKSNTDAIIASSKHNDDGQMPVLINNTFLNQVENDSKIFLHRPNSNLIKSRYCGNMDCDGMKKNLLTDVDGKFLGSPGSVISQSEFEWGSQARGLGDFRIPPIALYNSNGAKLIPLSIYTYPGIVRDQNTCNYRAAWQAHECHGLNYAILIIESMDSDSERRRLSPVAIVSDSGYLDLINGPGSHDLCFGYNCQKRISTFIALVASNRSYDIYLTSTPPKQLRFRIIQATRFFKLMLSMKYTVPNNINVYSGPSLMQPKNAYNSTYGKMLLKDPMGNLSAYMPSLNDPVGSNYRNSTTKQIFFIIDSSTSYIDLAIAKEIYVTFNIPATTASEFFNPLYLIANIAYLLNVPPSMIIKAKIVSASGVNYKRASDQDNQLEIGIGLDPPANISDLVQAQKSVNLLENIAAFIANQYYFGQLQIKAEKMNLKITGLELQVDSFQTNLGVIAGLMLVQDVSSCRAQSPCDIQPILQLVGRNVSKFYIFL